MIELTLVAKHILVVSIQLVTYTNFRSNGVYDSRPRSNSGTLRAVVLIMLIKIRILKKIPS